MLLERNEKLLETTQSIEINAVEGILKQEEWEVKGQEKEEWDATESEKEVSFMYKQLCTQTSTKCHILFFN